MNGPVSLVVYAFNEEGEAEEVLRVLQRLDKEGVFDVLNAAVLVRDESGKATLKETEDIDARRGALFGALVGGLVGLVGGPAGVIVGAAAGAVTGGVAAHEIDMGFSDEYLREFQESLKPGSSALIALVEHEWVERLIEELEKYEGQLFRQAIRDEIAAQLAVADDEGGDVDEEADAD